MTQVLRIHPSHPQARLIQQAVAVLRAGGVIAYPTDSSYAIGCHIGDKAALDRIRLLRQTDKHHNFTLICRDLSEIATYARIDNSQYRLLKAATPGAFTFILRATQEVPRRLQHPKRKTIGIRIPDHPVAQALLAELNEPIISSTLILPGDTEPLFDPEVIQTQVNNQVDLIIDGGLCSQEPTTVLDLVDGIQVIRQGRGDASPFL